MIGQSKIVVVALVLTGMLAGSALGDAAFPEPTVPAAWQSLDVGGLVGLAKQFSEQGGAGKANRALLGQYLAFKYLNDPAATKTVSPAQWRELTGYLSGDVAAGDRPKWTARLRTAFAPDQTAATALADQEFADLVVTLTTFDPAGAPAEAVKWVEAKYLQTMAAARTIDLDRWALLIRACRSGLWKNAALQWAGKLRQAFGPTDAAVGALTDAQFQAFVGTQTGLGVEDIKPIMIQRIFGKDLASDAAVKAVGLKGWHGHVTRYAKAATDAHMAKWRGKLRANFAPDAAAIVALSDEDFGHLTWALRGLKDAGIPAIIASRVTGKYLADEAATRAVPVEQWGRYVQTCKPVLSKEEQTLWATRLRQAFAKDEATLAGLTDKEFPRVVGILGALGQTDSQFLTASRMSGKDLKDVAATRAVTPAEWHTRVSTYYRVMPQEMKARWTAGLRAAYVPDQTAVAALTEEQFGHLEAALRGLGDANVAALASTRTIAVHLKDVQAVQAVPLEQWARYATQCAAVTPAEAKADWAVKLHEAFANDAAAAAALSDEQFGQLLAALSMLGQPDAQHLSALRITGQDLKDVASTKAVTLEKWQGRVSTYYKSMPEAMKAQWAAELREAFAADAATTAALNDKDFDLLLAALRGLGDKAIPPLVVTRVTAVHLKDAATARAVGLKEWSGYVSQCAAVLSDETKAQWAAKLREAFATPEQLKKLSDEDFARLLGSLHGLGVKDIRDLLVARLGSQGTKNAAAVRAEGLAAWTQRVGQLGSLLPAETKAQWLKTLREAFAASEADLAALSAKEYRGLAGSLTSLGDKQVDRLTLWWMKSSDNWRTSDPEGLAMLARTAGAVGDEGLAVRQKLVDQVATRYVHDTKVTPRPTLEQWASLVGDLAGDVPAAARPEWVGAIRAAFSKDPAALAALKGEPFMRLCESLEDLGDETVPSLCVTYTTSSEGWKSLGPSRLAQLAKRLSAAGGAAADTAKGAVAAHVTGVYINGGEGPGAVPLNWWSILAGELAPAMSPEARALWVQKLRQAYAVDGAAQAKLSPAQFKELSYALGRLGDAAGGALTISWVAASGNWQSADPPMLYNLVRAASLAKQEGQATRQALGARITATYAAGPEQARSVGPFYWQSFADGLTADLTPEARQAWRTAIRSCYLGDAAALKSVKAGDFIHLARALRKLGDGQVRELAASWVDTASPEQWDAPETLGWLAQTLAAPGEETAGAKRRLAERLVGGYLTDAASVRAVSTGAWSKFSNNLSGSLSAESRKAWAARLRETFLEGQPGAAALSIDDLMNVAKAVEVLDGKAPDSATVAWMADNPAWKTLSQPQLTWLAQSLRRTGDGGKASRSQLADHLSTRYIAADPTAREVDPRAWCTLAKSLYGDLTPERRAAWAGRLHSAYVDNAAVFGGLDKSLAMELSWALSSLDDKGGPDVLSKWVNTTEAWKAQADQAYMIHLGWVFHISGAAGKSVGQPAFAEVLARLAREGKLRSDINYKDSGYMSWEWSMAVPLGSAATQKTLRGELIDADGNPRVTVAKILAWVYFYDMKLPEWRKYLDEQIAANSGDKKAWWLLAKAYAMVPSNVPQASWTERPAEGEMRPMNAKPVLDQALAAASSEPTRLAVVREYAALYRRVGLSGIGVSLLESLKGQFSGAAATEVDELLKELGKK